MGVTRLHISVLLGIVVVAWGLVLWLQGAALTREHLAPFGTVVGVLAFVAVTFDRYLWRIPLLHGWFVKRPNLRGTWHVELHSDWTDPDTARKVPPISAFMGVEQRFSHLQMHLMTPESESWLIAEAIRPARSGAGYEIPGVYTNQPGLHLRGVRSEIHHGALVLTTHGPEHRPEILTGEYWTDRGTAGRMELSGRMPTLYTRFEDAERASKATTTEEGEHHGKKEQ